MLKRAPLAHYIPELEISVEIPVEINVVSRESDETNVLYQSKYFDYTTTDDQMHLLEKRFGVKAREGWLD